MNRKQRDPIALFLLISLIFHLLFLGITSLRPSDHSKKPEEVELTILDNRSYQIADIAPPKKEEKPKDSKFLGLYDSRVEQERVRSAPPQKKAHHEKERGEGPHQDLFESVPDDFYPDHKIGDRTYLNVLRFPKIGYFVRLKKIFKTTFNPGPAVRPYLFSNQISRGQIEVSLAVSIDRAGRLAELFVIRSSGLSLYDKEALRTIRDSAPFATPPSEILDSSSLLRMVWTFTVYL